MINIEELTEEQLIEEWKTYYSAIYIVGQCGSSDIQRWKDADNEILRRDIDFEPLEEWAEQAQLDWADMEHDEAVYQTEKG